MTSDCNSVKQQQKQPQKKQNTVEMLMVCIYLSRVCVCVHLHACVSLCIIMCVYAVLWLKGFVYSMVRFPLLHANVSSSPHFLVLSVKTRKGPHNVTLLILSSFATFIFLALHNRLNICSNKTVSWRISPKSFQRGTVVIYLCQS